MRSHEIDSHMMAVQIEIPTTVRLSEYLDAEKIVDAMGEYVAKKVGLIWNCCLVGVCLGLVDYICMCVKNKYFFFFFLLLRNHLQ